MSRPTLRFTSGASALLSLALALAGAAPLGAQQRVEITTRRAPRTDGDTLLRRLKLRVDSLARAYNDNDELSAAERQRVGEELDRTVQALDRALASDSERLARGAMFRVQVAPMGDARAAEVMTRTLSAAGAGGPRGWLGIVVNGVAREPRVEGGELIVHYLSYPEIISVEPSSPAQRAGLTPGDTLYAYDGRDVKDVDISMTRLLKPNARVLVRTGANGRVRDVPVTIEDAPTRIVLRSQELIAGSGAIAHAEPFPMRIAPPRPSAQSMVAITATPAPTAPAPASVGGLVGARMQTLGGEWARLTGVPRGVLVVTVPVGSIAAASGLAETDVIVKAAGQPVSTLGELRNILATTWGSGERSLAIEFVRERKTRSGTLRW